MSKSASGVVRAIIERMTATTDKTLHALDREPLLDPEFLRGLLSSLPGMAYRCGCDPDWTMEFVSHGCRALTGFAPSDLVKNRVVSYASLIHPDDLQRVRDSIREGIHAGGRFQVTYRLRRVDGRERTVWEQGCTVPGTRGGVIAREGFVTDITDLVAFGARAKERESQFRALVEQSLVGVYIVQEGRFKYVNRRFAEIFGYSVEDILALTSVVELVHPDDRELVSENLKKRVEGVLDEIRYDFRATRKDGGVRIVEVQGRRVEVEGAPVVMGILVDVTEREHAERRRHDGRKLDALARLATGVAHDLNNFLSVIKTTAQLLMIERAGDTALSADLDEIVSAVERGTALSRQLAELGGPEPSVASTVSLGDLVENLVPALRNVLGAAIELRVAIEPHLPDVTLDPPRAEAIVMNLATNARDAMPGGGTLTIRVLGRGGDARPSPEVRRPAQHVVLEVSDTGVGLAADALARIFEPYFTTKGEAHTGLGLAKVQRIVNSVGGVVEVASEPGEGATFRVLLPVQHPTRV